MIKIRPVSDLGKKFPEIELKLDEADQASKLTDERFAAEEVFERVRNRING